MCNKNVNFLTKKLINRDLIKENALRWKKTGYENEEENDFGKKHIKP